MSFKDEPPWTKGRLKALGRALRTNQAPPTDCPGFIDVLMWNHDLCVSVQEEIDRHPWTSVAGCSLLVSSRAKTRDTLVQKLDREHMALDQVQDLAGVRIDGDFTLTQQTKFAQELADHFGVTNPNHIKDLRRSPHSGYRAVHVWLRLPAGRVEVQIRTQLQSAWANFYERLGDTFGRAIRYGGRPLDLDLPDDVAQMLDEIVVAMHDLSEDNLQLELGNDALQKRLLETGHDEAGTRLALQTAAAQLRDHYDRGVERFERLSDKLDGPLGGE